MSKIVIQWGVSLLMVASAGACWAQDAASYPARTIRMIIALAPGGGVDTSGRLLGQKFTDAWGQQVVAENRAGAGGTIATGPPKGARLELIFELDNVSVAPLIPLIRAGADRFGELDPHLAHVVSRAEAPYFFRHPLEAVRDVQIL
jgi:tripartite-type tricarboxylate transporter receptor subunit TctC